MSLSNRALVNVIANDGSKSSAEAIKELFTRILNGTVHVFKEGTSAEAPTRPYPCRGCGYIGVHDHDCPRPPDTWYPYSAEGFSVGPSRDGYNWAFKFGDDMPHERDENGFRLCSRLQASAAARRYLANGIKRLDIPSAPKFNSRIGVLKAEIETLTRQRDHWLKHAVADDTGIAIVTWKDRYQTLVANDPVGKLQRANSQLEQMSTRVRDLEEANFKLRNPPKTTDSVFTREQQDALLKFWLDNRQKLRALL